MPPRISRQPSAAAALPGRKARAYAALALAMLLGGCGGILLPSQTEIDASRFESFKAVHVAFDDIQLGRTSVGEMAALGFDVQNDSNVAVLSYLDIVERFMPNSSMAFDKLDPAVQACIMARSACEGFVIKVERHRFERSGSLLLDLFGFLHTTTETGWTAQVLVLVQNGNVTHKLLSGEPNVQIVRNDVEPLGPVQNLSGIVMGVGSVALRAIK